MENLTHLIGGTPLFRLNHFSSPKIHLYAKLEGQNIGGSVKDRVALALIQDLEEKKLLTKNRTIIEASSGNTGIGLAMLAAAKGYKIKIIMPENATAERTKLLRFYGAEVEFCSKEDWKGDTAIEKIKAKVKTDSNLVMPNQYENPACVKVHYETTGTEILEQLPVVTHLVAMMGTGGTITGIAKRLKEENSSIQIIGGEIVSGSKISGPRSLTGYVPPILDFNLIDKREKIELSMEDEVFELQKKLAQKEGLFVGPSSAAALFIALKIAEDLKNAQTKNDTPKHISIIFPDRGEKYLSLM